MKKKLCAVGLLTAAIAAPALADDFSYLSVGGEYTLSYGFGTKDAKESFDGILKPASKSGMGVYVKGSYGFDNDMFVYAELANGSVGNKYFAGVGYHFPISQQIDMYGVLGLSKAAYTVSNSYIYTSPEADTSKNKNKQQADTSENKNTTTLSEIKPTDFSPEDKNRILTTVRNGSFTPALQLGVKLRPTEDLSLDLAYRIIAPGSNKVAVVLDSSTLPANKERDLKIKMAERYCDVSELENKLKDISTKITNIESNQDGATGNIDELKKQKKEAEDALAKERTDLDTDRATLNSLAKEEKQDQNTPEESKQEPKKDAQTEKNDAKKQAIQFNTKEKLRHEVHATASYRFSENLASEFGYSFIHYGFKNFKIKADNDAKDSDTTLKNNSYNDHIIRLGLRYFF